MAAIDVGFENEADLFVVSPGDAVHLQSNTMRWDVKYQGKSYRWCAKEFRAGTAKGMDGMTFRVKSDSSSPLWVQIEEAGGEGFYIIVTPNSKWKSVTFKLSALKRNDEKVINGRLDVDQITKIVVLDAAGLEGSKGRRKIWFADWKWTSKDDTGSVQRRQPPRRAILPAETISIVRAKKLSTGKVGLSAVPRNYNDSAESFAKVFNKAREAGIQVLSAGNAQWTNEIEPRPGVYDWRAFERFFSVLDQSGNQFEISFDLSGFFFHTEIRKPSHLRVGSITDPKYIQRYKQMATSFLEKFGNKITYLVIHAEGAYSYFDKHPGHLDDFCRMVNEVRQLVKQHSPHVRVGVNTDPINKKHVLSEINRVVDFMGYDVMKCDEIRKPAELEKMIKKLIAISGEKKIAIQNGGWSTSVVEQSSEQMQLEFIREFYRVLRKYQDRIEYASFYVLHDEDVDFMMPIYRQTVPGAPEAFVRKMAEANARFGLFRNDGSAKPGWNELKAQVEAYYKSQP